MLVRLRTFCRFGQKARQIPPAPTNFPDFVAHVAQNHCIEKQTIDDIHERTFILLCGLSPKAREDLIINSFPLASKIQGYSISQPILLKIHRILVEDSRRVGYFKSEAPFSLHAFFLIAMHTLRAQMRTDAIQKDLTATIRAHLKYLDECKKNFSDPNFKYGSTYFNQVMEIATVYHNVSVVVSLLQLMSHRKKMGYWPFMVFLKNFTSAIKLPMYETDRQNMIYCFIHTIFPQYLRLTQPGLVGNQPNQENSLHTKQTSLAYYAAVELQQNDLPGLQRRLYDLCFQVKNQPIDPMSLINVGGILRIIANIGINKPRLMKYAGFLSYFNRFDFDKFKYPIEQKTFLAYHLCLIEISQSFDSLAYLATDHPAIRVLNSAYNRHIPNLVNKEFIDKLLASYTLKENVLSNAAFVFQFTLPRLLYYLKEIKKFNSPWIEAAEKYVIRFDRSTFFQPEYPADIMSTSSILIELQQLLLTFPGVSFEREKRIGPFSIDLMVTVEGGPTFALEFDGPIHFMANGAMTSRSNFRNYCLVQSGIKVASLRAEYFEMALVMGTATDLLARMIEQMNSNKMILVGFEGDPFAQVPAKQAQPEEPVPIQNDFEVPY